MPGSTRNLDPSQDFTAKIEDAIEAASHVAVCVTDGSKRDDSYVQREIVYAQSLPDPKPIVPLRFARIVPHIPIVTLSFIDFFRDWSAGLDELLGRLERPLDSQEIVSRRPDASRRHLERQHLAVVQRLRESVLDPEDVLPLRGVRRRGRGAFSPGRLPLKPPFVVRRRAACRGTWFTSFAEAFEHHDGRLSLVGEPGGGRRRRCLRSRATRRRSGLAIRTRRCPSANARMAATPIRG